MKESSYIAALAASVLVASLVAAPHGASARSQPPKGAGRQQSSARVGKPAPARPLALMNLTPRDYLVRPYGSAYQAGDDKTPLAVDYRFAADGVASFGLHRGSRAPGDGAGIVQPYLAEYPTTHSSVGALVTYSFR